MTEALHIRIKRSQRIAILKGQSLEKCLTRLHAWIFNQRQFEFLHLGQLKAYREFILDTLECGGDGAGPASHGSGIPAPLSDYLRP